MKCILMRSGVKIWVSDTDADKVQQSLANEVKWLKVNNEFINSADISGVFSKETMVEKIQESRGLIRVGKTGDWENKRENTVRLPFIPELDKIKEALTYKEN